MKPFFFFNLTGLSFPLCCVKMDIKLRLIFNTKFIPTISCVVDGFRLYDEKNRFVQIKHEYLVIIRNPPLHSKLYSKEAIQKKWYASNHITFGKDFHDRVYTLYCCINRLFGHIVF